MKLYLTRYGWPQIAIIPIVFFIIGVALWYIWPKGIPWVQIAAGILTLAGLLFFRDPERTIPQDAGVLVAPADGKITDIEEVEDCEYLAGKALRIGIFLSIFDVHINRSPCRGQVEYIREHAGSCINAMRWKQASEHNQAVSMGLNCRRHPAGKVLVKQITGAIARRIVCAAEIGDQLERGEKYGMIKFGSRTELYLPLSPAAEPAVKVGQAVKAGESILVRYRTGEPGGR